MNVLHEIERIKLQRRDFATKRAITVAGYVLMRVNRLYCEGGRWLMARHKINVKGTEIVLYSKEKEDYISLTDIARYKDSERSDYILQNWMRNRSTIEFIGLWEQIHNPNFNSIEFDGFKNEAGSNSFTLTPKKWITATNAIGVISKAGRYGGTYAHQDIAFEFASWISAEFKLYLFKECGTIGYYLRKDRLNPLTKGRS